MTDQERQRLAAILGMLGSAHAGERAAAGLQAEAFRKKHRLTWAELLALSPAEPIPEPPAAPPPTQPAPPSPTPRWGFMQLAGVTAFVVFWGYLLFKVFTAA